MIATLLAVDAWSRRGAWGTDKKPPFPCPVASTSRYRKQPEPDVFRTLLAGCMRKREVDIVYTARTREITTKFSPHTVVQTAQRVHFRGYSTFDPAKNGYYWDLVPSRVSWAQLGATTGYIDGAGDTEWKERSVLQLTLCPDIPPQMRAAIRREHGMESDILIIYRCPRLSCSMSAPNTPIADTRVTSLGSGARMSRKAQRIKRLKTLWREAAAEGPLDGRGAWAICGGCKPKSSEFLIPNKFKWLISAPGGGGG